MRRASAYGGGVRRIRDLFGITLETALRYSATTLEPPGCITAMPPGAARRAYDQ